MAENTILNVGSGGDTISTEDFSNLAGGYKIPREKIVLGLSTAGGNAVGASGDVDGGDVCASNPMPIGAVDQYGKVQPAAADATVLLLRKIVKLLESSAVQDAKNRQRVVIDAIGTNTGVSTEVNAAVPVSGSWNLTNQTGTYVYPTMANALTIPNAGGIAAFCPVDQRWEIVDRARMCYGASIRPNLIWSLR